MQTKDSGRQPSLPSGLSDENLHYRVAISKCGDWLNTGQLVEASGEIGLEVEQRFPIEKKTVANLCFLKFGINRTMPRQENTIFTTNR